MDDDILIVRADTSERLTQARTLFEEYAASLNFDLCFQHFHKEVNSLPGDYAPPEGCLLLALYKGEPAGCVALRKITAGEGGDGETRESPASGIPAACEMKRLYTRPAFRGRSIGRKLATAIMDEARKRGYTRMLLDTLPSMKEAVSLYRSLGFKTTRPYCYNPIEGALFMEIDLQPVPE